MDNLSHRKAVAGIRLIDKNGAPVCNKTVKINQINHEFLFGCGAFESLIYVGSEVPDYGYAFLAGAAGKCTDREIVEDRMNKWLNLFNYGSLPFYWSVNEPDEGKTNMELLKKAAGFLRQNDVKLTGTPLCWHVCCAPWLMQYDSDIILKKQLERIRREVGDFRGLVDIWNVVNEPVSMLTYDRDSNPVTRICKAIGRERLIKAAFEAAQSANPKGEFIINDYNTSESFENIIDSCLDLGVPISAVGIQSHQHQGIWGKDKQDEVLERFERFGLPVHFTENTIVAAPLVSPDILDLQDVHYEEDAATCEYEEMQADALERQYRNLFENHPLVKSVTNWDYGDGAWLNAPSGLIRKDGSLKPAYKRLYKLIKEEWHTELTLVSDEAGFIEVNGFKGRYELFTEDQKGVFYLSDSDAEIRVVLA
ncbi:MAG: endo-1,4-beta-xylanase [Lachnospiraceae bacterium]|nr:endo-1,4-beta-xylanase [Lachnospiraceae bacterium]